MNEMADRLDGARHRLRGGSVHGLPVSTDERYVTRAELAEMMAVSVSTVDRFVRDGMPSETWGTRSRRFLPSRALAWARTREISR
jgi:predicted DNA-binding transcriptional regulator AlpA